MAPTQCFMCQLPITEAEAFVSKGKSYCSQCRIAVGGSPDAAAPAPAPEGLPSMAAPAQPSMPPGFGPPPSAAETRGAPAPSGGADAAAPKISLPLPGRPLHYEHSGTIGFAGPVFMLSGALAVAAVTGFIYAYVVYWIPLIYVNALACLGYGAFLGYMVGQLGKAGSLRSSPFALLMGFFAGVFAVYFSWAIWFQAHASLAIWSPAGIFDEAGKIAVEGLWGIGGIAFKGGLLKAVWAAEAAIIVGSSTLLAWLAVSEGAFCESCHEWLARTAEARLEPVLNPPALIPKLERGDFAALAGMGNVAYDVHRFCRLELWACNKCRFLFCLSLSDVSITKDAEGNKDEDIEVLLDKLIVSAEVHDWAVKRFV